jgi:hypothetical protein
MESMPSQPCGRINILTSSSDMASICGRMLKSSVLKALLEQDN